MELQKSLELVNKHKGNIWFLEDFNMPELTGIKKLHLRNNTPLDLTPPNLGLYTSQKRGVKSLVLNYFSGH